MRKPNWVMCSQKVDIQVSESQAGGFSFPTTRDAFLDGRLTILQPDKGPRTAIDAFFLASAIPAIANERQTVLEAGTGTGVVALALLSRVPDARVTGVDCQPVLLDLARRNARLNGWEEQFHIIEADVTASGSAHQKTGLKREGYDHVAANPPFFTEAKSRKSDTPSTAKAYTAGSDELEKWIRFLATMAAPRGSVTLIHRAEALTELLSLLEPRFGALSVFPLFPKKGEPATRVLVQGLKGSRAPLKILQGMVLHEKDGAYTPEADAILRENAAIDMVSGELSLQGARA